MTALRTANRRIQGAASSRSAELMPDASARAVMTTALTANHERPKASHLLGSPFCS
jgi:hypothetical protein